MKDLQIFNNPEFGEVRCVEVNGKPYTVGIDIAGALGYVIPHKAVRDHCRGVLTWNVPHPQSPGNSIEMLIIPEGDIYRLIVKAADQSKSPEIRAKAERFEKWVFDEVIPAICKIGKYEAASQYIYQDEYLRIMDKLTRENNATTMGKGDRAAFFRLLGNLAKASGNVSSRQQKLINSSSNNNVPPTPSDLLNELLSHAVPWLTFIPRSETELKSSILYDEKFYYIFPWATEKHFKQPEAKKMIYREIKFLDGINKNKKFKFWFNNESKNYHIWILHREAVMLSPLLYRVGDSSAQVGGDGEKGD